MVGEQQDEQTKGECQPYGLIAKPGGPFRIYNMYLHTHALTHNLRHALLVPFQQRAVKCAEVFFSPTTMATHVNTAMTSIVFGTGLFMVAGVFPLCRCDRQNKEVDMSQSW